MHSREKSKNTTTWPEVWCHSTGSGGDLQFSSLWYPMCQGFLPLFCVRLDLCDTRCGISHGQSQPVSSTEALTIGVRASLMDTLVLTDMDVLVQDTVWGQRQEKVQWQCDMKLGRAAVFGDTSLFIQASGLSFCHWYQLCILLLLFATCRYKYHVFMTCKIALSYW